MWCTVHRQTFPPSTCTPFRRGLPAGLRTPRGYARDVVIGGNDDIADDDGDGRGVDVLTEGAHIISHVTLIARLVTTLLTLEILV